LSDDRLMAPDIATAADLIRSGALAGTAGAPLFPSLQGPGE
jgi:hypothetical protein